MSFLCSLKFTEFTEFTEFTLVHAGGCVRSERDDQEQDGTPAESAFAIPGLR